MKTKKILISILIALALILMTNKVNAYITNVLVDDGGGGGNNSSGGSTGGNNSSGSSTGGNNSSGSSTGGNNSSGSSTGGNNSSGSNNISLNAINVKINITNNDTINVTYGYSDTYVLRYNVNGNSWLMAGAGYSYSLKNYVSKTWNNKKQTININFSIRYRSGTDEKDYKKTETREITDTTIPNISIDKTSESMIKITGSDNLSGVSKITITKPDGSTEIHSTSSYTINNPSVGTYKVTATDNAGNISEQKTVTVSATSTTGNNSNNNTTGGNNNSNNSTTGGTSSTTTDTTAPTLTLTYKKPDGTEIQEGEFTNQDVTVTVTANESIKSINGWTLSGKTLSKTYTENTEETITVSDSAGNTSKATIKVTQIDKSAPQITGVTNEGVYSGKVTPKVTDANLDKITLKKDGVEQTNWQNEQEITEEGSYEITATDKAGNSTTYSFTIKKISPEDIKIKTEEYKEYTEEKIIAYVEQQETVKNFIEKLKVEPEGAKVVVLDAQGKEVSEEETIKTGMKVKIEDQDTYVISVLGDLNGDGESDLRDVATFVSTLLNGPQEDVIEGFKMAADFNKDGEMALIDLTKMIVTLLENMTTTSN